MRAQHDALGKDVLAHLLEEEGTVEKEKVVAPKDSQRIDLVFTPDAEKRARQDRGQRCLRLIRRMTEKTCMFELFSSPLSETVVLLSQRKQISVLDELLVHARRRAGAGQRPTMPVQWILAPTRPQRALTGLGFQAAADWPHGFYCGAPSHKIWIVALNELDPTRETLALRLLGTGRTRLGALAEISAMSPDDEDRPLLLALLGWIRYVVRENRRAAEHLSKEPEFMAVTREGFELWMEKERQRADARIRARAIAEGKAEGKAEGLAVGKAEGLAVGKAEGKAMSLLAVLEARRIPVSVRVRAQILTCTDDRLLDEWIRRAVTAASAREVLSVAN
jgi:hypothetical protein